MLWMKSQWIKKQVAHFSHVCAKQKSIWATLKYNNDVNSHDYPSEQTSSKFAWENQMCKRNC